MRMRGEIRTVMGATDWLLLLALGALWGGSYFFGKVALAQLAPFSVAAGRLGLAAVVLHMVVRIASPGLPRAWRAWRAFWVMGLLNNVVPMSLILWGQRRIGSGLAAILNASTPLFTVLLAHCFTRDERLTSAKIAGVLFGLGGVAVMIGPEALGGARGHLLAQLAMLGAAISYACAGIFGWRSAWIVHGSSSAGCANLGGGGRARRALHGPRVRDLLPHPRQRGGEQSSPRDPPDAGECGLAGRYPPRRAHRCAAGHGHGADRRWSCRHRRQAARSRASPALRALGSAK